MSESIDDPRAARRDLFELAVGYAEESVIVTSADLEAPGPEILYVNTAFTKMTGYSSSELIGQNPRFMQGPLTDRQTLNDLKAAMRRGEDFIARAINYRRDGTPFELEWIIKHLRDEHGETMQLVAVQRDITGIERASAALAEIDEELRSLGALLVAAVEDLEQAERLAAQAQRMTSLGRMARGISHDLTNSLGPMSWILQLLEVDSSLDNDTLERVVLLRANLDHAMSLSQHLSDFAGDGDESPRILLDVGHAIDELLELTALQRSASGRAVSIDVDAGSDLSVLVNPVELRQVLVNLVLNAVEAMPDGGSLTIRAQDEGDVVMIEVADSGQGMHQSELEHCFEPFFTTKELGTGLGLAICHGLITRQGGTIDVTSELGRGTAFQIRVPRSRGAEQ